MRITHAKTWRNQTVRSISILKAVGSAFDKNKYLVGGLISTGAFAVFFGQAGGAKAFHHRRQLK
ncbi:MAG: hypothetical protein ACJ72Z_11460 [Pyrinomonadaceae bacterium]